MPLFDLSILDVLSKVVADGPKSGMHLYAEIASESYGSFICRAFLFTEGKKVYLLYYSNYTCFFFMTFNFDSMKLKIVTL